jgi:hypothetical protein
VPSFPLFRGYRLVKYKILWWKKMEIKNGNGNIGSKFTFGIVLRGEISEINKLIDYLKQSSLKVAFQEIGQNKMWIKTEVNNDY